MSKCKFYAKWDDSYRTLDGEKVYRGFWLSPDPASVDGSWYHQEFIHPEVRVVEFRLSDLAHRAIQAMRYTDDSFVSAAARAKAAADHWGFAVGCEETRCGDFRVDIGWQGSRPGDYGCHGFYACRFGVFRPGAEMMKFVSGVQRDGIGDDHDPTPGSVVTKLLDKGYIPLKWVRSEYESARLGRTCWDTVLVPHTQFAGPALGLWKTHAEYRAASQAETAAAS